MAAAKQATVVTASSTLIVLRLPRLPRLPSPSHMRGACPQRHRASFALAPRWRKLSAGGGGINEGA